MSDASVRGLLRTAEQTDEPEAWTRAAQACARAGLGALAGRGLLAAAVRGVDPGPALDALAPPLEAFRLRTLGERFGLGRLWLAAWRPDGGALAVVEDRRVVRRLLLSGRPSSGAGAEVLVALTMDVTALCFDPASEALVLGLGSVATGAKPELLTLDLQTGRQTAIGRGHQWIQAVACDGERIVVAERHRIRAYPLRGADRKTKSLWSAQGFAALDPSGASIVVSVARPRNLELLGRDGGERGTLTVDAELPMPGHAVAALASPAEHFALAGGRRALIVAGVATPHPEPRALWLLEEQGAPPCETSTPASKHVRTVAPSPSGRLVALGYSTGGERSTEVGLLDLRTDELRSFDLGARPRDLVWSPSGQTLAIATDQGTVVLLDGAPGATEAAPAEVDGWLELRSGRQFWSARQVGTTVELRHGRVGAAGQQRAIPHADEATAAKDLARRVREREREGYVRVVGDP